ncbi:MAG: PaaI family thioesterase [Oscillospiraceae bacterium]|nr:PaaI family thioesterase [Oscillospiraceae bacterium]
MVRLDQQSKLYEKGFVKYNQIQLIEITPEYAVSFLETVGEDSLNPYGIVHGGVYFTMADVAAAALARTDGRAYVTLDSSIHFLRSARQGASIRATAHPRHRGKSTFLSVVEVTDQDGRLLASADFTFFCLGDKPPAPPSR